MLKINDHYKVTADSYSYALQEQRTTQKGEESWIPVGYYPTIIGALKRLRGLNHKKLLSTDEVILIGDLITSLEAVDQTFLSEIKAIEDQIKEEPPFDRGVKESEPEEETESVTKPKRKSKKDKTEELLSCFTPSEDNPLLCTGKSHPQMFAENDCIHCDSYGCPEIV